MRLRTQHIAIVHNTELHKSSCLCHSFPQNGYNRCNSFEPSSMLKAHMQVNVPSQFPLIINLNEELNIHLIYVEGSQWCIRSASNAVHLSKPSNNPPYYKHLHRDLGKWLQRNQQMDWLLLWRNGKNFMRMQAMDKISLLYKNLCITICSPFHNINLNL